MQQTYFLHYNNPFKHSFLTHYKLCCCGANKNTSESRSSHLIANPYYCKINIIQNHQQSCSSSFLFYQNEGASQALLVGCGSIVFLTIRFRAAQFPQLARIRHFVFSSSATSGFTLKYGTHCMQRHLFSQTGVNTINYKKQNRFYSTMNKGWFEIKKKWVQTLPQVNYKSTLGQC